MVILKENLDRLCERRTKVAIAANKRAARIGERHPAADRAAESYEHWIGELKEVMEWVDGVEDEDEMP